MYNKDFDSLNAGAPDIRLSGNQDPNQQMAMSDESNTRLLESLYEEFLGMGFSPADAARKAQEAFDEMSKAPKQNSGIMAAAPKGTYTQNRKRQMAAGGGIMGSNNGSMLVAPTADGSRPGYAWYDKFIDPIIKVGQTIIPGGETGYFDLYGGAAQAAMPTGMPQGVPGGGDSNMYYKNPIQEELERVIGTSGAPGGGDSNMYYKVLEDLVKTAYPSDEGTADEQSGSGKFEEPTTSGNPLLEFLKKTGQTIVPGGEPGFIDLYNSGGGDTSIFRQAANIGIPLAAGKFAHDYQRDYLARQPAFPMDQTGITFQTARQAMDNPNLRFKPKLEDTQLAASGGRIGYAAGGEGMREGIRNAGIDLSDFRDKIYSDEARALAGMSGQPGGLLQETTNTGDFVFKEDIKMPGQKHTRETLDAANKMLDIKQDRILQLEKLALERGISQSEFKNRLKYFVDRHGNDMGMSAMASHIGVFDDFEGNRDPNTLDQRLEAPNYLKRSKFYSDLDEMPVDYAQGGRIGLKKGSKKKRSLMDFLYDDEGFNLPGFMIPASIAAGSVLPFLKEGGRVPAQEGGLMDLGGMEKDYRQEGGFVPIGGQEKADDVPARLSKNEFVFTADAVRNAGGGDIDKGAEIMENMMNNLEAGGEVSEESQGLEGARGMFANAQELEKRII